MGSSPSRFIPPSNPLYMIITKPLFRYFFGFLFVFAAIGTANVTQAQDRERVITPRGEQDSRQPARREGLTNKIVVKSTPGIKKTSSSRAENATSASLAYMTATTRGMIMDSIRSKYGLSYRYGTQGPNTYDCSGFIWKVFNEAGIDMIRTSAREFWRTYEPVSGDERFVFGTLVFFNRLGHVGIVANKDGFYHASSSRGVTYSKFEGYWEKRIVGFRRVPIERPTWSGASEEEFDDQ